MLRKIKYETEMTAQQLAEFLNVAESTIYNWEKKNLWPLWALEKCGYKVGEKCK